MGVGRCKLHGGKTSSHRASSELAVVERDARAALARLGKPEPLGRPVDELLALGAEVRQWLAVLREQVMGMETLVTHDIAAVERAKAVVDLYTQAQRDTQKLLVDLLKLDLDARRVMLAEREADLMGQVIDAMLREVRPDDRERVRSAGIARLAAVSGG